MMLDEYGKPIELGRGAMGVTYKAFDVDLRIAVTLKLITEKYSAMNRRGFAFCAKRERQQKYDSQTSPRSSV
jgi:hypothetical protein